GFEEAQEAILPVRDMLATPFAAGFKVSTELVNGSSEFSDPLILRRHRPHDGRVPTLARHHQTQHRIELLIKPVSAFAIGLIENENVTDLHEAGFHVLNIIAESRNHDHENAIRQAHNID